jgi:hypothetical protein
MKFTIDVDNKRVFLHQSLSFDSIELIKRMIDFGLGDSSLWKIEVGETQKIKDFLSEDTTN